MYTSPLAPIIAAALFTLTAISSGAVVFSGNYTTGSPVPTVTITTPITYTVTTAGNIRALVFVNSVTTDSSLSIITPTGSGTLSYKINDGATMTVPVSSFRDNNVSSAFSTINDGYLLFGDIAVVVGDKVTILGQSLTFTSDSGFNRPESTFSGTTHLGGVISGNTNAILATVPEPSAALLGALGSLAFLRRRR